MATELTTADVVRVAALAQLELTGEEETLLTRQLADILAYAAQLQALETSGVPPTAYVQPVVGASRPDEPRDSLAVDEALANAPDPAPRAGLFRVPRVIGE